MSSKKRRILPLVLSIVVVAVSVTGWWLLSRPDEGPLDIPPHYGYSKTLRVEQSFTDAYNVLWLRPGTRGSARIVSVEPVWESPHVATEHTWATLPSRPGPEIVPMVNYPTARPADPRLGRLVPVQQAPIKTEKQAPLGTQILFSTRVLHPGHYLRKGFTVAYTLNNTTYRAFVTAQITICTPGYTTANGECPPLGEGAN